MTDFLELVQILNGKTVDGSRFIDFHSYVEDGLGMPEVKDNVFYFPGDITMACIQIAGEYFLLYKNFIPLWRFNTIEDCDPDNWKDLFPTQHFFLIPATDINPDNIEKVYSQIFANNPELTTVLAVERSYEGF